LVPNGKVLNILVIDGLSPNSSKFLNKFNQRKILPQFLRAI